MMLHQQSTMIADTFTIGTDEGAILSITSDPGGGKSAAVDYWFQRYGIPSGLKVTDRPARSTMHSTGPGEPVCISLEDFTRLAVRPGFYQYTYGGYRYGFFRHDLLSLLTLSRVVTVIHSDETVALRLHQDFRGIARVIRAEIRTDGDILLERLRATGASETEIQARINRASTSGSPAPGVERVVIDNNFDWSWFQSQLDALVAPYLPIRTLEVAA